MSHSHSALSNSQRILQAVLDAEKSKALFMNNLSHELRTPVHGINGLLQLLANEVTSEKGHELVMQAWRKGNELAAVIDEILDFSSLSSERLTLKPHPFEPQRLLNEIQQEFTPFAERKGLELTVTAEGELPPALLGDFERIHQSIRYLLDNGIKFTAKGGKVSLQMAAVRHGESFELAVVVSDSGIGIDAAHLDRIFHPFWQVERSRQRRFGGLGLGLPLAEALLELMGSHLEVQSQLGEGSQFCFTLLLAAADPSCIVADDADLFGDFDEDEVEIDPLSEPEPIPILDTAKLAQLQATMQGQFSFILTTFLTTMQQRLAKLESMILRGGVAGMSHLLLDIRSSSLTVAAVRLAALATDSQQRLQQGESIDMDRYLAQMQQALAEYEQQIQSWL